MLVVKVSGFSNLKHVLLLAVDCNNLHELRRNFEPFFFTELLQHSQILRMSVVGSFLEIIPQQLCWIKVWALTESNSGFSVIFFGHSLVDLL